VAVNAERIVFRHDPVLALMHVLVRTIARIVIQFLLGVILHESGL